jgi:4-diphosphocytidyl-2-C-methyl-D-erythritol kinase
VLVARANGKVNLGLEIIGRRPDGYHDIVTIIQEIDLSDRLTFRMSDSINLSANVPALVDDTNLVLRAANLLRATTDKPLGSAIALEKQIPVAAGLGGGSADAAVTFLALNRLWRLGMSYDDLVRLARTIGADVAFFLAGGTQLATGRGDVLEPLPTPPLWAVLVVETAVVHEKTKQLYGSLCADDFTDGSRTLQMADDLRHGRLVNYCQLISGFQRVSFDCFPALRGVFDAVAAAGGLPLLCGAGPTVMSLHDDIASANQVVSSLDKNGYQARLVTSVAPHSWLDD